MSGHGHHVRSLDRVAIRSMTSERRAPNRLKNHQTEDTTQSHLGRLAEQTYCEERCRRYRSGWPKAETTNHIVAC